MARIRSIHPGIFTDEAFMALTAEHPLAVALLIGLWTEADDNGIFEWKPLTLKARLLPAAAVKADDLLAALEEHRFIRRYEADGKVLGAVRNFTRFQRPKKPQGRYPVPNQIAQYVGLVPNQGGHEEPEVPNSGEHIDDESPTGQEAVGNRFGTGGEKSPQMEDGGWRMEEESPLTSFVPPAESHVDPKPRKGIADLKAEDFADWASTNAPGVDVATELAKAQDWTRSKGKRHKDAAAFVRNWLRKAHEDAKAVRQPSRSLPSGRPDGSRSIFDLPDGSWAHDLFLRITLKRTGAEAAELRKRFFADPTGTLPELRRIDAELRGAPAAVANRDPGAPA